MIGITSSQIAREMFKMEMERLRKEEMKEAERAAKISELREEVKSHISAIRELADRLDLLENINTGKMRISLQVVENSVKDLK